MEETVYKKFPNPKKCPFCGSDDIMIESKYFGHLFTAYCHNCFIKQSGYTTEKEAVKNWNLRAKD